MARRPTTLTRQQRRNRLHANAKRDHALTQRAKATLLKVLVDAGFTPEDAANVATRPDRGVGKPS
jgi:hypothetical protein